MQVLKTVVFASALAIAPALAAQVTVSGAWFRALPSNLPAGGYFTLHNHGPALQLLGAQSPACGMLMLHRSARQNGVESMSMVEVVSVAAGGTLVFDPGDYHLMCMDPSKTMSPGSFVPVTLKFSDSTSVTVRFIVRNAAGK